MMHAILQGALMGALLSVLIGPVFFLLIKTAISQGVRSAMMLETGIILSDISCIFLSYFGLVGILNSPENRYLATIIGSGLLIFYGGIIFYGSMRKTGETPAEFREKGISLLVKGFVFNLTNPSVIFFWVGAVGLTISDFAGNPIHTLLHFSATISVVFGFDILKIYLAGYIRKHLKSAAIAKISKFAGILISILGLITLIKTLQ
ncbi:MAG: LysE family translocator [Bacteroidota bacterium]|jgi:threonine/homoserine/homoserine lactone efflux protein